MSEEENNLRIEKISKQILNAQLAKAEQEELIANLKKTLAGLVEDGDTFQGDFKVNKRVNIRFDDATAKKNLSASDYDKITVRKATAALAKAQLTPENLAKTQKTFDTIITVGLRD